MWARLNSLSHDFLRDLGAVFQPRLANAPAQGRRRRMLYTVLLPEPRKQARQTAQKPRTRREQGS